MQSCCLFSGKRRDEAGFGCKTFDAPAARRTRSVELAGRSAKAAAQALRERLLARPDPQETQRALIRGKDTVVTALTRGEKALGDGVRLADRPDRLQVDAELAPARKGVQRELVAMRHVEAPAARRQLRREPRLAARARHQLERLRPCAKALGEQLAQPRARHDEAPAVALEAQPQRPAALGLGQQFPHRSQRLRSLVQPGGNHLDHVPVKVNLRPANVSVAKGCGNLRAARGHGPLDSVHADLQ